MTIKRYTKQLVSNEYDAFMDKQCLNICNAINLIKGIKTTESCCGHNRNRFRIWLTCDINYIRNINIISKALNRRYGGPSNNDNNEWVCSVYFSDRNSCLGKNHKIIVFCIESFYKGRKAYWEANKIAKNIKDILKRGY